jgi:formate hydrogenlyase subunit 6/NADH:ubiquinone oxidoreductase subunit I
MFKSLRVRASQGTQYITDLRKAVPLGFRGRPRISATPCREGCDACVKGCPTGAVALDPVRIDLGKCVFCAECALACPVAKIAFTPETRMGGAAREALTVVEGQDRIDPVETSRKLASIFGRSL